MPLNHPHLNSSEKLSSWGHILGGVRGENLSGFHLENTSGFCRELWSPSMDSRSPSQTPVSSCKRLSNKLVTVKLLGGGHSPIGACAKVRRQHQVSSIVSTWSLRQFLTGLELAKSVRVTAHNPLGFTCLGLSPPQHKEYRLALPCSASMGELGI